MAACSCIAQQEAGGTAVFAVGLGDKRRGEEADHRNDNGGDATDAEDPGVERFQGRQAHGQARAEDDEAGSEGDEGDGEK